MKQKPAKEKRHFLYRQIADNIEHKITSNVLKPGEKLPSVREICREKGVSMSSALNAYFFLESKGLIQSRPQSGYYVSLSGRIHVRRPGKQHDDTNTGATTNELLIDKIYRTLDPQTTVAFSLGVPSGALLPVARLNKSMRQAMLDLNAGGTGYDQVQGNHKLRIQIAKGSFAWNGRLEEEDIITTSGCINAISMCLMSLVKKGDTIAIESPIFFGVLQIAQSLGLKIVEIPTNYITGIDVDALETAFRMQRVKACVLVSNFSNPLGSCMPDENKKAVVRLIEKYNVPLIEDDLNADIYFGDRRPNSCKTFDESGLVLWCGSISKTLAPGYRVGWVAPGIFKEKVLQTKMHHALATPTVTQQAIGNFLETGRYENHLRRMRQVLYANSMNYLKAIQDYFPNGTRAFQPQGGFIQWVEFPPQLDAVKLYEMAIKKNISIAPGCIFSLEKKYTNCIRLSYGLEWNDKIADSLRTLGTIAKSML